MKLLIFSSVALLTCFTPVAYSWGAEGHRTVGRIAQNFLTNDVSNQVTALLGSFRSLENASTWADTIKRDPMWSWSAKLHFIDTKDDPATTCSVSEQRDCKDGNCIVGAITNYTSRLDSSSGLSFQERSIALRFLTHFFGDITQPLHVCGKELGGNERKVIFDGRHSENLHGIWDSDMVRKRLNDFSNSPDAAIEAYAANLTSAITSGSYKDNSSGWVSCIGAQETTPCPLQWAGDSDALNCQIVWGYVLDNPDTDLDGEYYDSVIPYIDMQLAKGGFRLGTFLNNLLGGTGSAVLQDYNT